MFSTLLATACQPTEPAMKVTAKVYDDSGSTPPDLVLCGHSVYIKGTVTPATATKKVVLQRTVGGKWVDEKGWDDIDGPYSGAATLRQANVSQSSGAYAIAYFIDWEIGTKHLRVRSSGGGKVSPSIYVEPEGHNGYCGSY